MPLTIAAALSRPAHADSRQQKKHGKSDRFAALFFVWETTGSQAVIGHDQLALADALV